MKKHIISIVCLIAGLSISVSCINEEKGETKLAKNEIAFYIGNRHTKADESRTSIQGANIPLGISDGNEALSFIETVEYIDFAPATKGTPAYAENVAELYGKFKAHVEGADIPDEEYTYSEGRWSFIYEDDPWEEADPIVFWMNMPVEDDLEGVDVDELKYEDGSITFPYESPAAAEDQKDILFTSKSITKAQYLAGNNHLTFFHALTGVKFAIGNQVNSTKITKIEFTGLYDSGTCTVTPSYASGVTSADCVAWADTTMTEDFVFAQEFDGTVITYDEDDADFGESFYKAGYENNVNDEDASLTFWFIPQTLTADVKVKVTYTVGGNVHTQTIDFGKKLQKDDDSYPTWQAGELRTYTLNSTEVDIAIDDDVDDGVKSDVEITNTGNVDCYVRAAIIGFWCDGKGKIVDSWRINSISDLDDYDEGFVGLPGDNWVRGASNFFYYTEAVKPGLQPGQSKASDDVDLLFTSYTEPDAPSTYPTARLKMSVMVQAIPVGDYDDYQDAWSTVAGVTFPSSN